MPKSGHARLHRTGDAEAMQDDVMLRFSRCSWARTGRRGGGAGALVTEVNSMSEGQILALTEEIYDAAAGGTPWAVVGRSLSKLVRASNGWLCVMDHQGENANLLYR